MNFKLMARLFSMILLGEAVFMAPAFCIALGYEEERAAIAFAFSMGIILFVGAVLSFIGMGAENRFSAEDGMTAVGGSWILMSLLGCLPFVLSGEIPNYIDALFEIVSGFTTTGSSVVPQVELLSKSVLYWRSFSHWVGGMGVLVFLLAIVPLGGKSQGFTMHLLRAESPGPDVGKLVPKMRKTAMALYLTYIALSVLNLTFLLIGDMPLFDAICTMFGTAGTGGFGIKNDSMASYSPYLQNVTTVFMLLFGINFSCYYLLILGHIRSVLRDEELRLYLCVVTVSILLITWNIASLYSGVRETLRHAAFQVSTVITTTGFATTDFNLWPSFSKAILLVLMFVGSCAGSTGGGFKCARILMLLKGLKRNVRQMLHPNRVQVVRINQKPVEERVLANTNAYLCVYVVILIVSILVISLDGFSFLTNFSAVMACFNNIGPGLDMVGPSGNFSDFGYLSKIILTLDMLAGRLEIFPILLLFNPSVWVVRRKNRKAAIKKNYASH